MNMIFIGAVSRQAYLLLTCCSFSHRRSPF